MAYIWNIIVTIFTIFTWILYVLEILIFYSVALASLLLLVGAVRHSFKSRPVDIPDPSQISRSEALRSYEVLAAEHYQLARRRISLIEFASNSGIRETKQGKYSTRSKVGYEIQHELDFIENRLPEIQDEMENRRHETFNKLLEQLPGLKHFLHRRALFKAASTSVWVYSLSFLLVGALTPAWFNSVYNFISPYSLSSPYSACLYLSAVVSLISVAVIYEQQINYTNIEAAAKDNAQGQIMMRWLKILSYWDPAREITVDDMRSAFRKVQRREEREETFDANKPNESDTTETDSRTEETVDDEWHKILGLKNRRQRRRLRKLEISLLKIIIQIDAPLWEKKSRR